MPHNSKINPYTILKLLQAGDLKCIVIFTFTVMHFQVAEITTYEH